MERKELFAGRRLGVNSFRESDLPKILAVELDQDTFEYARNIAAINTGSLRYDSCKAGSGNEVYNQNGGLEKILRDKGTDIIGFFGLFGSGNDYQDHSMYFINSEKKPEITEEIISRIDRIMKTKRAHPRNIAAKDEESMPEQPKRRADDHYPDVDMAYLRAASSCFSSKSEQERRDILAGFPVDFSGNYTRSVSKYFNKLNVGPDAKKEPNLLTALLAGMIISDYAKGDAKAISDRAERLRRTVESNSIIRAFCDYAEQQSDKVYTLPMLLQIYKKVADELGMKTNLVK